MIEAPDGPAPGRVVPPFDSNGSLPPGVYRVALKDIEERFAWNETRRRLFTGLQRALENLAAAGVRRDRARGDRWGAMIQNQRQYNVTKGQIARLEGALEAAAGARDRMPARVYKAMVAGIESQVEELRQQLREFEELQGAEALRLESAEDLPQMLIKARVARGYTQKDLAEKLGIKPQQIQKYEATGYRSVSLSRLLDIMKALGLDLQAVIPLTTNR